MERIIQLVEKRLIPDPLVRLGIRQLCGVRRREVSLSSKSGRALQEFIDGHVHGPIAVQTHAANEQHYEVPSAYFSLVLGPYLKYSSGYWPEGVSSLDASERAMLDLSIERAEVEDGMRILDLGCGWGSMTMRLAERFPNAQITAVSNSSGQRAFIESLLRERGFDYVKVLTRDINELDFEPQFDRILSVEMFEHMRNHALLMERVHGWLNGDGKVFVHVFCHHSVPYLYEVRDGLDWMAKHFFSGGMMPSRDYLPACSGPLRLEQQWDVNGTHYGRTCRAWLEQHELHTDEVERILDAASPHSDGKTAAQRWRMFFMACEELFRYRGGNEWFVSHYRFSA